DEPSVVGAHTGECPVLDPDLVVENDVRSGRIGGMEVPQPYLPPPIVDLFYRVIAPRREQPSTVAAKRNRAGDRPAGPSGRAQPVQHDAPGARACRQKFADSHGLVDAAGREPATVRADRQAGNRAGMLTRHELGPGQGITGVEIPRICLPVGAARNEPAAGGVEGDAVGAADRWNEPSRQFLTRLALVLLRRLGRFGVDGNAVSTIRAQRAIVRLALQAFTRTPALRCDEPAAPEATLVLVS